LIKKSTSIVFVFCAILEASNVFAGKCSVDPSIDPNHLLDRNDIEQVWGFASPSKVIRGETIDFKIANYSKQPYSITIYLMGYFDGEVGKKVATIDTSNELDPPPCIYRPDQDFFPIGCANANWAVSGSWATSNETRAATYIAQIVTEGSTGYRTNIHFTVENEKIIKASF